MPSRRRFNELIRKVVEDDGTGIQGSRWNCPCLPPSIGEATHPSSIPLLNYLSWTSGTAIAKSKQRSINKVTTLLFWDLSGGTSSLPISGSQSRSPASAKDSKLTCSEFTLTLHSYPAPSGHHCTSWHLMYALIVHTSSTLQLFMVLNCVTSAVAASIAVHGERVSLAIVSPCTWFYEHLYCTDSDILFHFL